MWPFKKKNKQATKYTTVKQVRTHAKDSGYLSAMCKNCGTTFSSIGAKRESDYCSQCEYLLCKSCTHSGVTICEECQAQEVRNGK